MTILWCGNEDIDFPNGTQPTSVTGFGRSGWVRGGLQVNSGTNARSLSFSGGAVTSAWLHFELDANSAGTQQLFAGLGLNAFGAGGIFVGTSTTSQNKAGLYKWDGTTITQLAAESGTTLPTSGLCAIDMQIASYGASSTVNVYVNGTLVITYSGSTAIAGMANLDCVAIYKFVSNGNPLSEFIVADIDTRGLGLATLSPNAAGDSSGSWTGAFSNINPFTINDANVVFDNVTGSDFQANLTDPPAGTFVVLACKAIARASVPPGSTPTGFKLGVKTGGTVDVDAGHTCTTTFTSYERLMAQNPVTSVPWTTADLTALQVDLQSM
jgi:hypothetical protein